MKLSVRGLSYEHKPSLNQSQATIKPFQRVYRESEHMRLKLTYRGLNYNVNPNNKFAQVSLRQEAYQLIY